jgi:hypothetical protein
MSGVIKGREGFKDEGDRDQRSVRPGLRSAAHSELHFPAPSSSEGGRRIAVELSQVGLAWLMRIR